MKTRKHSGFTVVELTIAIIVLGILALMFIPGNVRSRASRARSQARWNCINNLKQVGLAFHVWAGDHQGNFPAEVSITNGGAMEAVMVNDVAAMFQVMSNELGTPKILFCPTDKESVQATTFVRVEPSNRASSGIPFTGNGNLSYFAALNANTNSFEAFLSGDDNFLVGGVVKGSYVINGFPVAAGTHVLSTNTPVAWSETRHERQGNVGLADGSVQGFSTTALRTAIQNTGTNVIRLAFP